MTPTGLTVSRKQHLIRSLMNRFFNFALIITACLLFADESNAERIIMIHETEITISDLWVDVQLTIKNEGDEDALMVYPSLKFGDQAVDLKKSPYIAFGGAQQWNYRFFNEKTGRSRPGRYPLYLLIHYHDSQMYPFSSPDVLFVEFGPVQSDCIMSGEFASSQNNNKRDIKFTLTNECAYPISGTFNIFLPQEFQSQSMEKQFLLAQKSNQSLTFTIENTGALKGSRYRIYGVAEYKNANRHLSFAFPGMISVTESIMASENENNVIGCVVFILILFFFTLYLESGKAGWKSNQ